MCEHGIEATQIRLFEPRSDGRTHASVDPCIAPLVQALNCGGLQTIGSCCGHGQRPGIINLVDGRELIVMPDFKTARSIDHLFPDIHGNPMGRS
jgi:hypothetical protein